MDGWVFLLQFFRFAVDQVICLENAGADENVLYVTKTPVWVANRVARFLALDSGISSIDLSYLKDKVTLLRQS